MSNWNNRGNHILSSPCKDCRIKQLHCHATCNDYIDYKNRLEEVNEKKRRENEFIGFGYTKRIRKRTKYKPQVMRKDGCI